MTSTPAAAALVEPLRRQMTTLFALLAPLADSACSVRPAEGWSIRETLSHLMGAEGATFLDGIHRIVREDAPAVDVEPGLTYFHADRRDVAIGALLAAVVSQYRAIADVIAIASDETLARRAHIALLAQTPFGDRPTLGEWVTVIAGMHVAGHIADLQAQVGRMSNMAPS